MIELDVLTQADLAADGQPKAWRSLEHKEGAAGYEALLQNEFMPGAADGSDLVEDEGTSRRSFLKVMGASMALAGLTGCRRPEEQILPYARKPEEIIPGLANFYATAMPFRGVVEPLLVESHEGRPTKIEGNPDHPVSQGAASTFAYASMLTMYDPDRSRVVRRGGQPASWQQFVRETPQLLPTAGPIVVLAEPTSSPTLLRLREQFLGASPGGRWITYDPAGHSERAGVGAGLRPAANLAQATVIVSFDADFLGAEHPNSISLARGFGASRNPRREGLPMSRVYCIESQYTPTGAAADHRRRLRASDMPAFAAAVASRLGNDGLGAAGNDFTLDPMVEAIAEDVQQAGGRAAFFAGPAQPPHMHALCAALNAEFGGEVVSNLDTGLDAELPLEDAMQQLVRQMRDDEVGTLLMIGVNPVYDLPGGLRFDQALARVPLSIHLGLYRDETAQRSSWHLPRTHFLEAWGDGRAYDGTLSIIQPLIAPIHEEARSEIEVMNLLLTGLETPGYNLVRQSTREVVTGRFEDGWRTLLHDGFLPGSEYPTAGAAAGTVSGAAFVTHRSPEAVELVIRTCSKLYDGSFSNNAWMQEAPEPITKLVWDNVALMSRATAEELGVRVRLDKGKHYADLVTIETPNGTRLENIPIWIQPGHPDNSVTVHLGYGRELQTDRQIRDQTMMQRLGIDLDVDPFRPGPVANGIGGNVAPLRQRVGENVIPSVVVSVAGGRRMLASTQDHGSMEGRPIVRQTSLSRIQEGGYDPRAEELTVEGIPYQEYPPIWGEERSATADPRIGQARYSEHQWAMTIDLNSCTGCNACLVACQSENNVPVVGKDQVSRGREMHWLRLDRYYTGENQDEPGMVMQPMLCQHCEYAPCEPVCPVAATVHSPDGINEMVYNRCIGTRYCSNNCPYKVRRFNFYNWTKTLPIEVQMAQNPNVTVRFRGVMEKCTFCVHRIRRADQFAHIEGRSLEDGEVQTACQQACPTNAIVFGDLNNPDSEVVRNREGERAYELLAYLNVKPRVSYLSRVHNPNPRLAAAAEESQA
ncbi:TAT-variant-translocated molybdopterin oxidoreductase [soil metagenome]